MAVNRGKRPYRSVRRAASVDGTRSRILSAARLLLSGGKGLPAFSVEGVAEQAGVTRLTVYNQFESKQGLLEAMFDDLAREGGLAALPRVFALADAHAALREAVTVFCRFWDFHRKVMPKFGAMIRLDEELAPSLRQRAERRRTALTVLVKRLGPVKAKADAELADILFALTSFEMFDSLSVNQRNRESVEELVQTMVQAALDRFMGAPGK